MPDIYNPYSQQYTATPLPASGTYPPNYQPYQNNYQQTVPRNNSVAQPMPNNNQYESAFIWVEGRSAVDSYLVAAGGKVYFMQTDFKKLYIKSTDSSGRPMPVEEYSIFKDDEKPEQTERYITVDEFEKRMNELTSKFVIRREKSNG